ncbi:MAG: hypothetical protein LBV17_02285 [Treponema sp.]|jgi:hypothetical protein|nr:hypothetical protein [Treponema sp.]
MIYEKCKDILMRERELVQSAAEEQEKMRLAVFNREWQGFEENVSALTVIERQLVEMEDEREQLFCAFEALLQHKNSLYERDGKGRFYAMVALLPENQRNELTSLYRNLKMETLSLRIANETLRTYLGGIKNTIKEFFDKAFPQRAGKIYTQQGTHLSHDMRSMVVNQSF